MSEVELSEPPGAEPGGGYKVTLPSFEGPLDLLLHLCQKHELDILDIPIGFITEKYLEYLAVMQLMNLDVASEYLVMAASLAHIKSKMLLPAPPPGQEDEIAAEEEDPREALIRRLLEYQKYKKAGEDLASRGVAGRDVFQRGSPIEEAVHTGLPPLAQVPLFNLVEAFQNVLSKSKIKISHDIVHERITLTDRINELVDVLRVRRRVAFEELFNDATQRFDLVITFLAILEMTRLRMTRIFQADFESHIYVEFSAQVTADDEGAEAAPPDVEVPGVEGPGVEAPGVEVPADVTSAAEPLEEESESAAASGVDEPASLEGPPVEATANGPDGAGEVVALEDDDEHEETLTGFTPPEIDDHLPEPDAVDGIVDPGDLNGPRGTIPSPPPAVSSANLAGADLDEPVAATPESEPELEPEVRGAESGGAGEREGEDDPAAPAPASRPDGSDDEEGTT